MCNFSIFFTCISRILNLVSWSQKLAKTNYNILHGLGIYLLTWKLLKLSRYSNVTNCLVNWLFLRNCCPVRAAQSYTVYIWRQKKGILYTNFAYLMDSSTFSFSLLLDSKACAFKNMLNTYILEVKVPTSIKTRERKTASAASQVHRRRTAWRWWRNWSDQPAKAPWTP